MHGLLPVNGTGWAADLPGKAPMHMQAANAGAAKAAMPFGKTVLLGIVAGAYIGLCSALLMTGGSCL